MRPLASLEQVRSWHTCWPDMEWPGFPPPASLQPEGLQQELRASCLDGAAPLPEHGPGREPVASGGQGGPRERQTAVFGPNMCRECVRLPWHGGALGRNCKYVCGVNTRYIQTRVGRAQQCELPPAPLGADPGSQGGGTVAAFLPRDGGRLESGVRGHSCGPGGHNLSPNGTPSSPFSERGGETSPGAGSRT